ncbi:adhesion G-protein coupled receptor G2-like [Triplophysa rosa]|uniref:adhesion G-protein coupled receptor G2-like n=1 Tax=Triplophysa rosa TaxID=992332 RepID=UPI002545C353|nr:adhesion G-protein coupled receptor G2-like [Triplophysa rosa]
MVGAEYMTHFLYMALIFGAEQKSTTTKQEKFTATTSKPNQVYDGRRSNTNKQHNCNPKPNCLSITEKIEWLNDPKNPEHSKNKTHLKDRNREETEFIIDIINITSTNETKIWILQNLDIAVVKIDVNTTDDLIQINASMLFNDTQAAQIWIPVETFQNFSEEEHKVGVVSYDSGDQFTLELENAVIVSKVTRIEVPGHDIVNLTDPLRIHFPVNMTTNNGNNYSCQFFDDKDTIWRDHGCSTRNIRDYVVECSCNHMTAFAVLLVELKNTDEEHWTILSYISYIGCGLSAVFSGCSILTFIINSNGRKVVSRSIHVSLSAALFLLNITFMLSEWAATINQDGVCVFVAVAIHYSLLCCFTWMAIEALHLYLLLVRVFNIYIQHYMAKLSLIGWGVPAILIGGLLTVSSHPLYGTKKITLSDANKTNEICWTTEAPIPYAVNISYFAFIFLFNTGILITVSLKIFMLRKADKNSKTVNVCKNVSTVLGLMCLLGITWGLVFFTSGYTNYPILYLFCILNSMQGFYIFLWMCLTARPEKQQADQKSTFTVDTTDNYKQNS